MLGRNADAPLPVIAAATPSDCFEVAVEAVRLATRYMTPVILLSGIALGIVTPTEAAVVAVFYTGLVGFVVYRKLGIKSRPELVAMLRPSTITAPVAGPVRYLHKLGD